LRRRQRRRCRRHRTATVSIARVIRDIAANQALERRRDGGIARHRRRWTTTTSRCDASDPSVVVARITDDDDDDDDARVRATAITHATSEVWAVAVAVVDVARRQRSGISLARTVDTCDTWTRHLEASRRTPTRGARRREGLTCVLGAWALAVGVRWRERRGCVAGARMGEGKI
jgi:hypothetical protein